MVLKRYEPCLREGNLKAGTAHFLHCHFSCLNAAVFCGVMYRNRKRLIKVLGRENLQ